MARQELIVLIKCVFQKSKNIFLAKHAHNLINDLSLLHKDDNLNNIDYAELEAEKQLEIEQNKYFKGQKSKISTPKYDYCLKILLVGDIGVGKTSLLLRYNDSKFLPYLLPTSGYLFIFIVLILK